MSLLTHKGGRLVAALKYRRSNQPSWTPIGKEKLDETTHILMILNPASYRAF